ncbi:MAG: CPXCG motif-containing cysteine-rich protein [Acidobacteria bacterium]|nr:CPXCG motif-containing cysteine-rich protein [Acidobacteriota bacterium]
MRSTLRAAVGGAAAAHPESAAVVEIYVEPDVKGSFVQDCEVCCNPWRVRVRGRGDDRRIDVSRADGSE